LRFLRRVVFFAALRLVVLRLVAFLAVVFLRRVVFFAALRLVVLRLAVLRLVVLRLAVLRLVVLRLVAFLAVVFLRRVVLLAALRLVVFLTAFFLVVFFLEEAAFFLRLAGMYCAPYLEFLFGDLKLEFANALKNLTLSYKL